MIRLSSFRASLCGLWAGTILGGSLIAAPAKFSVSELPLADLLRVGRAQFHWLGNAEVAFGLLILITGLMATKKHWHLYLAPVVLLGIQHILVLPSLQQQTDMVLLGGLSGGSVQHFFYAALDVMKITILCALSLLSSASATAPNTARADV